MILKMNEDKTTDELDKLQFNENDHMNTSALKRT